MGRSVHLIVGLGNPGPQYVYTRHNLGFMVVSALAEQWGISLSDRKFPANWGQGRVGGEQVILAQPLTYMNLSGQAVSQMMAYFRLTPDNLVVIHDDLDVPQERLKLTRGGGPGGHRGIMSIMGALNTPDFLRVKLGVGRPPAGLPAEAFVLRQFAPEDLEGAAALVDRAVQAVAVLVTEGLAAAQNRFHGVPEEEGIGGPSP